MEKSNVYETEPSNREDLKHTDTVSSTTGPDGNELPIDGTDGPIGVRVDRDPTNLGNDIPEEGDLVHPSPVNQPLGKMPGM
jgi:hypothetical protein